jgi:hypothetical protein
MKVIVQHGNYQCATCGHTLAFEPTKITEAKFAVAMCGRDKAISTITGEKLWDACPQYGIRLLIPITTIECEEVK